MKFLILAVLIVSVFGLDQKAEFMAWAKKHQKTYPVSEYASRFEIYKQNLVRIKQMNDFHTSAKFAVNKFADLTAEEFKQLYLSSLPFVKDQKWPVTHIADKDFPKAVPDSYDWRDHGAVTGVKDQGQCGSCWAFSTIGNLEGQNFLAGNKLIGLSEQNLVDCDHHCMQYEGQQVCDQGCDGGLMPNAFQYVIANGGIDTEASYAYLGVDSTCNYNAANKGATLKNWTMIPSNETQMLGYLLNNGPVSVAVDATEWQFYFGGIFDFYYCGTSLDHGVLIVAYGHQDNFLGEDTPYWVIKNSWGADWGESGYIKLERNEGLCGIDMFPCTGLHN